MKSIATALLGLLLLPAVHAGIIGDQISIEWFYPTASDSAGVATVTVPGSSVSIQGIPISVSATGITVTMTGNGFGAGSFNGFILTDVTKVADFTSFSLLGDPLTIAPALTYGSNFLQVNFTPTGEINFLKTGGVGTVLSFTFTTGTATVPDGGSTLLLLALGVSAAAGVARRARA